MPTISASPSPVGVYSRNPPKATTFVSWNTESAAVGTASVSENGGQPKTLGSGQAGGPVPLEVTLGSTYRLSLTVPPGIGGGGSTEVAAAMVETFDLRQQMAAGFSQAFVPQLGMPKILPQMITGLVVRPGVDTVHISFRTTLPTIPTTELRDEAGNWVDGKLPLFGGLRTRHEVEFGFEEALALNKRHSFRIEAFGPTGDPVSPNKAVVTGEFITGTRNVDVVWEMLDLHDDSDSTGAGELMFAFAVGDVGTGAALGDLSILGRRDISDDEPPIDLGITQSLTDAHRELWLQVLAQEDDKDFLPFAGISARGFKATFSGPGGRYKDDGDAETVELTIVANVDTDPGLTTISFELRTGDWPLDFVVTGHLDVDAIVGSVIAPKMTKSKLPPKRDAFLTKPGEVFGISSDGSGETAEVLALGADGALYHRRRDRQGAGRRGQEWNRIELPGVGKPVAVASGPDSLDLVDLDERGAVLHCEFDAARPKRAKWRKLGGNFRQVVSVADAAKRKGERPGVALFGINEDGALHVHDARSEGRDWTRLGDVPVVAVAPVSGNAAALIAVSADGSLLHFAKSKGRWRSEPIARKAPGEGPTQLLTAAIVERVDRKDPKGRHRDLVIGAMNAARQVQALNWPNYPEGSPESRWRELGSLQDLMLSQPEAPKRGRKPAKK